jgi:hypothetical protein
MREMDFKTPGSGLLEPKKKVSGTAGEEAKWGSKRTTKSSVVCLFVFFWWGPSRAQYHILKVKKSK